MEHKEEQPSKKPKRETCETLDEFKLTFKQDVEKYFTDLFGEQYVSKLYDILKVPPSVTTIRTSNPDIEKSIQTLKTTHSKFELFYDKSIPDCIFSKVLGPNKVELLPEFVVVGRECGQSVLRGAHIYAPGVNGMTRAIKHVSILSEKTLEDSTKKGSKLIVPTKDYILVGNGTLKMDHSSIFHTLKKGIAVISTEPVYQTLSLDGLSSEYFAQNLPSILVGHLLNPQQGEKILDMCCAPGGKTSHICQLIGNKGTVIGLDRSKSKINLVQKLKKEQKLDCLTLQKMDATSALKNGFKEGEFDRILLDAPCSGTGLRPVFALPLTLNQIIESASYQKRLLKEAYALLKPGGEMVYSVCSFCPLEGEENVKWFLETYPDMQLMTPDEKFFKFASYGVEKILGEKAKSVLRFDPVVNPESIGFFVAKFGKVKQDK